MYLDEDNDDLAFTAGKNAVKREMKARGFIIQKKTEVLEELDSDDPFDRAIAETLHDFLNDWYVCWAPSRRDTGFALGASTEDRVMALFEREVM